MKILALEFSSERRSAAVWADGAVRGEAQETGGRASQAFALIERALQAAKLEREAMECIAVGIGPGSYTGIRAAISVAQGWQLARGVRLLGIKSVQCLATQAQRDGAGTVHVVIDAQRGDLYLATFEVRAEGARETGALRIMPLEEAKSVVASGGRVIGPEVKSWFPDGEVIFPDAGALARMAATRTDFVNGAQLEPVYLREVSFVKAPVARVIE